MSAGASGGWFASLGKGAKWFIGIVVVAAVGALVPVLIHLLLPPEEVSAKLSNISIDEEVTLDEYAIRHDDQLAALPGEGKMLLVAARDVAQAPVDDRSSGGGGGSGGGGETTTTGGETTTTGGGTTTTGTETTTTGTETTTTGGETTTTGRSPIVPLELDDRAVGHLHDGVQAALDAPNVPPLTIPDACLHNAGDPTCGLMSLQLQMQVANDEGPVEHVSTQAVEQQLAQVFRGTRTVSAAGEPGKRELVGVTVNFDVALTGFRGARADVRWSLYSARHGVHVPRDWLGNQRAVLLRGEADKDAASGDFWVPIPRIRGPFFIRIGVYDDDGTRLDYARTPRFR